MLIINIAPNALKQQFLIKIELTTALKVLKSSCKHKLPVMCLFLPAMCLFTVENVE